MTTVAVKKTSEITLSEWEQIVVGFKEEFESEKTPMELVSFYCANFCGYSYHGLVYDESGQLLGYSSVVPYQYADSTGGHIVVGLSGGSFVRKQYRKDIFLLSRIYKSLSASCQQDGFVAILGVPNKNAYQYLVRFLGFRFLYNLPFFLLPLTPKALIRRDVPDAIRWIWQLSIRCYIRLIGLTSYIYDPIAKLSRYSVFYTDESYAKRFGKNYKTIVIDDYKFTYRVCKEKGLQTVYLFDFNWRERRSLSALTKAVYEIAVNERADLILFVGKLEMNQWLLTRLPVSWQPKLLPLTIDVLVDENHKDFESLIDPNQWDFGLLNFDVR